jgi:hypothetical protein
MEDKRIPLFTYEPVRLLFKMALMNAPPFAELSRVYQGIAEHARVYNLSREHFQTQ